MRVPLRESSTSTPWRLQGSGAQFLLYPDPLLCPQVVTADGAGNPRTPIKHFPSVLVLCAEPLPPAVPPPHELRVSEAGNRTGEMNGGDNPPVRSAGRQSAAC